MCSTINLPAPLIVLLHAEILIGIDLRSVERCPNNKAALLSNAIVLPIKKKGENNEKGNTIDGVRSHSQLAGSNYRKCSHKNKSRA